MTQQQVWIQPRGNRLVGWTGQRRAERLPLGNVGTDPARGLGMLPQMALDGGPAIRPQLAVHIGVQILVEDRAAQFAGQTAR